MCCNNVQLHLNKLRIACAVLLTVGWRWHYDVQRCRVRARAARVYGRTYSEPVRRARFEVSEVVCRRVRARGHRSVYNQVATRPVE